ncbi:MAG: MarR family transcriptional regulator [Opitutae bacterium]|nr:MarR family transcriptional regulator [Opitutae bacterium]
MQHEDCCVKFSEKHAVSWLSTAFAQGKKWPALLDAYKDMLWKWNSIAAGRQFAPSGLFHELWKLLPTIPARTFAKLPRKRARIAARRMAKACERRINDVALGRWNMLRDKPLPEKIPRKMGAEHMTMPQKTNKLSPLRRAYLVLEIVNTDKSVARIADKFGVRPQSVSRVVQTLLAHGIDRRYLPDPIEYSRAGLLKYPKYSLSSKRSKKRKESFFLMEKRRGLPSTRVFNERGRETTGYTFKKNEEWRNNGKTGIE